MISKHTSYSILIPSVLFLIFHLVYPLFNIKNSEYKCTYINHSLCVSVQEAKGDVKNIDLKSYNVDSKNFKVNQEVIYEVKTIESKRNTDYLLMFIICFILALLIRFPGIFNVLGNIDL